MRTRATELFVFIAVVAALGSIPSLALLARHATAADYYCNVDVRTDLNDPWPIAVAQPSLLPIGIACKFSGFQGGADTVPPRDWTPTVTLGSMTVALIAALALSRRGPQADRL